MTTKKYRGKSIGEKFTILLENNQIWKSGEWYHRTGFFIVHDFHPAEASLSTSVAG